MRTATLFCFVGAILFIPTLGILRFVTNNPTRTDEYAVSDLRTMFGLLAADLEAGQNVALESPTAMMTPDPGIGLSFSTVVEDPNNNYIDEQTGLPFNYDIDGRLDDIDIEHESIHLVELHTEELEGGSSLSLNLTVRIEAMHVNSLIDCDGILRFRQFDIIHGAFDCYFNVELRYQSRFQLDERGGVRYLGQSIGQSMVTVNRITVNTAVLRNNDYAVIIDWDRLVNDDGFYIDELFLSVMSSFLEHAGETVDGYLRVLIGNRPYLAPQISLAIGAANASGYSCRRPEPRCRRETKLYNT